MRASTYPLIDAEVAAALVLERTHFLGAERVPLMDCAGRVLAEDIVAADPLPAFPSSAVDGYALPAADAGRALRGAGESGAGRLWERAVGPGRAIRILPGGVFPAGADCVVMREDVERGGDVVKAPAGLTPGQNFHAPGADLRPGEHVLPAGLQLGAAELGLAAALGLPELLVGGRPRVALLFPGGQLVGAGKTPGRGPVPDSNRCAP